MPKQREMTVTPDQARALIAAGVNLTPATLYQTLGPHWKDLIWIQMPGSRDRRVNMSKTHTHKQITALLDSIGPK